jgi:magnesium transporter
MTNIGERRKPGRLRVKPVNWCENCNATDTMLINCAAYQDGRKLADIDIEAISDYVSKPECFVWVALKEPTPDEIDLMGEEFGLHELALEDARKGTSGRRSRSTATRCSPCCIPSSWTTTANSRSAN